MHQSRFASTCTTTSIVALLAASLLAPLARAEIWKITQESVGSSFYDHFNFNNISDPTHGRVVYVDQAYAIQHNLTYAYGDHFVLRTDATAVLDPAGPGRPSVRLISKKQYGPHVTVADVRHMPEGCGTWPALWEKGNKWPETGEVDIIEGRNDIYPNQATLHTGVNCIMRNNTRQKGVLLTDNCDARATQNAGCGVQMPRDASFGPPFNRAGGGYFAMERTKTSIKLWFWPRDSLSVPLDVRLGLPFIATGLWGTPDAHFNNDACDIENKFKPAFVLINLTLCGDWAGNKKNWAMTPCSKQYTKCVDYINENPAAMKNAYFDFKALRIYEPKESSLGADPVAGLKVEVGTGVDA